MSRTPSLRDLRSFTQARVALGSHGAGLPTAASLAFRLDHARAREAVWTPLDLTAIRVALMAQGLESVDVRSNAADRAEYLSRPDKGRTLDPDSDNCLGGVGTEFDVAIIIADGLSATAVNLNAVPATASFAVRARKYGWRLAPVVIATQARVALSDPIGHRLRARAVVMLIGERPGLSASDSLGCYITYGPERGLSDARRNCISNIRENGLSIEKFSDQLEYLMLNVFSQNVSGVELKTNTLLENQEFFQN